MASQESPAARLYLSMASSYYGLRESPGKVGGMVTLELIAADDFYAGDSRRTDSRQWDCGFFLSAEGDRGMGITWLEATGEVCALIGGGRYPEGFILLGSAPSFGALEAILARQPERDATIKWVASALAQIPEDPRELEALVEAHEERLDAQAAEDERRELASFEVVELARLPQTGEDEAKRYRDADWKGIAELAVKLFEAGVSPRDDAAILSQAQGELSEAGAGLLWSLFADPIVVPEGASSFRNGRHRTAAMRAAGVRRCVVHTERGWR